MNCEIEVTDIVLSGNEKEHLWSSLLFESTQVQMFI